MVLPLLCDANPLCLHLEPRQRTRSRQRHLRTEHQFIADRSRRCAPPGRFLLRPPAPISMRISASVACRSMVARYSTTSANLRSTFSRAPRDKSYCRGWRSCRRFAPRMPPARRIHLLPHGHGRGSMRTRSPVRYRIRGLPSRPRFVSTSSPTASVRPSKQRHRRSSDRSPRRSNRPPEYVDRRDWPGIQSPSGRFRSCRCDRRRGRARLLQYGPASPGCFPPVRRPR